MDIEFMLCDLVVYFFIQFAIIFEDRVHFFEFLDYKVALPDDRFHGDAAPYKHLVDRHELLQLRIVNQFLKLFDLVLQ